MLASAVVSSQALAAQSSAAVQAEIARLMVSLERSSCEFNRNGSWYSAADAKKHLLQKLAYVNDKITLVDTEQFIKLAATASSWTGKPYLVRCPGSPAVESRKWLLLQLNEIRSSAATRSSGPK
jgi:hypothetical protein